MYKSAARFFQRFKERHGKNVVGKFKAKDPKRKKKKNIRPKASTNGGPKRQTLSQLLSKIYGRIENSPGPIASSDQEQEKGKQLPLNDNARIIRLKKKG